MQKHIRNIAIIAHVDHGKTSLVDAMLHQSGVFRENETVAERVMDSMDLERERGITIMAKNTAISYEGVKINIVDTPGHADFGGEVERTLNLVEGVMLLVDAAEGPLPQTRFVLQKSLAHGLPILVVINKIDRPDRRIREVENEILDLFIDLDAEEDQLEFPLLYTQAKAGVALTERPADAAVGELAAAEFNGDLRPLFEAIIEHIPAPTGDPAGALQFLATSLAWDDYVGRITVGKVVSGTLKKGSQVVLLKKGQPSGTSALTKLFGYDGLKRVDTDSVEAGDICAVAGVEGAFIGDTIGDPANPKPLKSISVEEPAISMDFHINDSPLAGRKGKFVTSRHLKERLEKEMLHNVSLRLEQGAEGEAFRVSARGELQLAVLVETMRREGYELALGRPRVITREENGKQVEPLELAVLDIPEDCLGIVSEKLHMRGGRMTKMVNHGSGRARLEFEVPTRGLIGFRGQFLTDTRGSGILNTILIGQTPLINKEFDRRANGALVADRPGKVSSYALFNLQQRGRMYVRPGDEVYEGMIVGENARDNNLPVNMVREKHLTNHRAANADDITKLVPPRQFTLEQAIDYIADDELVEVTPENLRLRKKRLGGWAKQLGKG
ncbi:translational GTPase TypA [bacterium]|nr:translational GTPase TypA [bacterium]